MNPLIFMDFVGVGLFAATGALTASRRQLDIIGFLFMALITGIGGGTLRDLILDVPVFWVENTSYVLICVAAALLVYLTAHLLESRFKVLLWLDAVALAAYGVFGAFKGLAVTGSPVVAVAMGVMTGTLGGILRDVVAGEPSVLMRREIYVTAALAGALLFALADYFGMQTWIAVWSGFLFALTVRAGALAFGWRLPRYRSRPGRDPRNL